MGAFRFFAMFVVTTLLILSLLLLGFQFALSPLLTENYYTNALEKSGSYETIAQSLHGAIGPFFKAPGSANQTAEEEIASLITYLTKNTLSYLTSETSTLDLTVEVDTEEVKHFYLSKVNNLTICKNVSVSKNKVPTCRPATVSPEAFLDTYLEQAGLTHLVESRDYNLADVFDPDSNLAKIRTAVYYYQTSRYVLLGLLVVLVGLLLLTSLHKEDSAMHWLSSSLLISGGLLLGLITLIRGKMDTFQISEAFTDFFPHENTLKELLFNPVLSHLKTYAFALLIIGAAIFLLTLLAEQFIKKERPKR